MVIYYYNLIWVDIYIEGILRSGHRLEAAVWYFFEIFCWVVFENVPVKEMVTTSLPHFTKMSKLTPASETTNQYLSFDSPDIYIWWKKNVHPPFAYIQCIYRSSFTWTFCSSEFIYNSLHSYFIIHSAEYSFSRPQVPVASLTWQILVKVSNI